MMNFRLCFMSIYKHIMLGILLCSSVLIPLQAAELVVSIKPLALIIKPLLLPDDQLEVIVNGHTSPHDYALKISDMKKLEKADLVLWVGPELERFLIKPVAGLVATRVMSIAQMPEIIWPAEHGGVHNESAEGGLGVFENASVHRHAGRDPHFWLNPANARILANKVSERLIQLRPQQAQAYRDLLNLFQQRLTDLHRQLELQFEPIKHRGFVVYHRAYDHIVSAYHLRQLAYITVTPERKPGARHLYRLRQDLKGQGLNEQAVCVFMDAGSESAAAKSLAKDLGLPIARLDPLALYSERYSEFMRKMAASLVQCVDTSSTDHGER